MRALLGALADLIRGLFGFPARGAAPCRDYADALEERYRRPRRCC